MFQKDWVVYAKKPFSGVNSVVEYLGRYTHKIAISNHRITDFDEKKQTVTFNYKVKRKRQTKLTLNRLIYPIFIAYFAKGFCKNQALWYFKQHIKTSDNKNYS
jgi:hypothetical protein